MRETCCHPSVLSYLLTERSNYCLRLQKSASNSRSPFKLLDNNDPLAHTFRGAFVTDYGSTIKDVDFLVQRDTIAWPREQENSLTNSMVDQYWQQATTIRQTRGPEYSMLLASQINKEQQLLAFAPLFYCRKREIFFEPPCPKCGKTLQLCKNDELLLDANLASYTKSLRRYLHCPSCRQTESHQIFYTLEKEINDPPGVHDCRQLLDEFSKINSDTGVETSLPCLTCQNHELCFGNQQSAHDTIFVFSFYPFFMLIKECSSLEGFHMLSLLWDHTLSTAPVNTPINALNTTSDDTASVEISNDEAILGIMQEMLAKYPQANSQPPKKYPPTHLDETLIQTDDISSEGQVFQNQELPDSTKINSDYQQTADDLSMETVIIGSTAEYNLENRDTLQTETVLLSGTPTIRSLAPDQPKTDHHPTDDNNGAATDDDLAETIILNPGKKP